VHGGRTPEASINFVTCHDGFTLRDLVSYDTKHNLDNGWDGRDGAGDNLSRNFGGEGPSDAPTLNDTRDRVARSLIAALACSLGVPMLLAGDELGRSQHGNNNAYGQDNEISWMRWDFGPRERAMIEHVQRCFALRHTVDAFRRTQHFTGEPMRGAAPRDVTWLAASGEPLREHEWLAGDRRALGMWCCGHDREGHPDPIQPSCLVLLNGGDDAVDFALPALPGERWTILLDTAESANNCRVAARGTLSLPAHALILLRSKREKDAGA
jgi:glycogen operon protein